MANAALAAGSGDVEDRRNEHDPMTQLLISMGLLPLHPDQSMRDLHGLKDEDIFDPTGEWLNYKPLGPADTLSMDLGANDLDNQMGQARVLRAGGKR